MTATRTGVVGRGAARLTPRTVHLATIVVSAVVIAYLGRRQWFYYDDWAYVVPKQPSLLTPHGGHLSLFPILLTHALRAMFGVRTYLPYLACAVVAHLVLAHLLWRVMLRSRVDPWIATAMALLLLLFGTGSADIFWAFQVGFMGAIACGVATVLLVTRERIGVLGNVGTAVITAIGLGTSGTSLPVVAAAIVLSLRFRGLRTTVLVYVVPVVLYLTWFATKPKEKNFVVATPSNLRDALIFIPRYVGLMFGGGFDEAIPLPGIGAVMVVCLAAWVGARSSRLGRREYAVPAALLASGVVFAALTAYSRFGIGLPAATSSRYLYFMFAACVPAIGAGASALAGRRIPPRAVAVLLILAATGYNLGLLDTSAHTQTRIEQGTRRQFYAALDFALAHPRDVVPTAAVDSLYAHVVTPPQLLGMHAHGWIHVGHYGQQDMLNALVDIATQVAPATGTAACSPPPSKRTVVPDGGTLTVDLVRSGTITLTVTGSGTRRSRPRQFVDGAGRYRIVNTTGHDVNVVRTPSGTTYCSAT